MRFVNGHTENTFIYHSQNTGTQNTGLMSLELKLVLKCYHIYSQFDYDGVKILTGIVACRNMFTK